MRALAVKKVSSDKKIAIAQQNEADAQEQVRLAAATLKKKENDSLKLHYMKQ